MHRWTRRVGRQVKHRHLLRLLFTRTNDERKDTDMMEIRDGMGGGVCFYSLSLKERLSSFYKERRIWLRETRAKQCTDRYQFLCNSYNECWQITTKLGQNPPPWWRRWPQSSSCHHHSHWCTRWTAGPSNTAWLSPCGEVWKSWTE